MPLRSDRGAAGTDTDAEGVPQTDVDLEADLENLRDLVVRGGPVWLSHRVWLDVEEFEARVDQIIALLPKEVRRARRIAREESRIIQDAKDEARRLLEEARAEAEQIVSSAREESQRLLDSSAIRQRALEQAQLIVTKAEDAASELQSKSYGYAQQVIGNVEASLKRLTQTVEQDKAQLDQMRPAGE
jgi:vacuolar-type H+-ATPase subunit H